MALKQINGNIWNLANNHTMDSYEEGMQSTLQAARDCGAQTIGIGTDLEAAQRPVIIPQAGGIGIFSVTSINRNNGADMDKPGCFTAENEDRVLTQIREIKRNNLRLSHTR